MVLFLFVPLFAAWMESAPGSRSCCLCHAQCRGENVSAYQLHDKRVSWRVHSDRVSFSARTMGFWGPVTVEIAE